MYYRSTMLRWQIMYYHSTMWALKTRESHVVRLLMLLVCFDTVQNFALIADTDR